MKTRFFLFFVISVFFTGWAVAQQTERLYLSGTDAANTVDWEFYVTGGRGSGEWTTIPVPSNWELQGFGTYNYGHDWRNEDMELGKETGLYRYTFDAPASWRGQSVTIVFEGAMTDTRVKINGRSAGAMHQGGFYRFSYDVGRLLKFGSENTLEVEVAKHSANESVNKAERQADYWIFGGIFRPVYIEVKPWTHIERAAIDARADGTYSAVVELNRHPRGHSLNVELIDMQGNAVGEKQVVEIPGRSSTVEFSGKFDSIQPWSPEWPHLYDMRITLGRNEDLIHQITERIGFRTVELREHDGFYINGEKVVFKGVNRHSFWPETGRALTEEHHLTDINLIKEMNMNAVRMSHYPPDKRFLELCDSIGLFVINEVAGWQDGYDTIIGPKVIRSTVLRDENHPSVVIWTHGNEGGWEFRNEKWFHEYDIQKRPVLYPWLLRNGADLHHYPSINYAAGKYVNGNDPFMPTEFLHGLYDGGIGAGLEDYWNYYQSSPLHAGGFLWVLADEAVLRTDKPGIVFDSDGNHAPDGIVGPHREKEGSFYTIREIWSPVQVKPLVINPQWNGTLYLENKFHYTNLSQCSFSWKVLKTGFSTHHQTVLASGSITPPDVLPGETGRIQIPIQSSFDQADLFLFTATDPHGRELYTWSWPVKQAWETADAILDALDTHQQSEISTLAENDFITVSVGNIKVKFSLKDGTLLSVENQKGVISLNGGKIVGVEMPITEVSWKMNENKEFVLTVKTDAAPRSIVWKVDRTGLISLEADLLNNFWGNLDFLGLGFQYPEEKVRSIQWMGRGPYRVWKNRLKGANIGVWEKTYNNTITGESFNDLEYPEFKGYHANLYWMILETDESPIRIVSATPNLYLQLFTPGQPKHVAGGTYPSFPEADLSFLLDIPAIGTKFKQPELLGTRSLEGWHGGHKNEQTYPIRLWFDVR